MDGLPDDGAVQPAAAVVPTQKRDEWSEAGIMQLLEAYEAKWLLRNRAKLKWSDWVDIAHQVTTHCSEKAPSKAGSGKTPNQCKNKIESMKKRYRAESAAAARAGPTTSGPSWRFYAHMDGLLKGPVNLSAQVQPEVGHGIDLRAPPKAEAEADVTSEQLQDVGIGVFSNVLSIDANGGTADKVNKNGVGESRGTESNGNASSPRSKEGNDEVEVDKNCDAWRKRKGSECEIAKSIELLANSILKIEQARMEMYRDSERMKVEAEIRRGEMELKRTEIVAKTQLQIAKIFMKRLKGSNKSGGSSSLTAELDILNKKGENG